MKNRYLITGANGFLGNVMIRELNARGVGGDDIVALTYGEPPFASLDGLSCMQEQCDVTDREDVHRRFDPGRFSDPETRLVVIHTAGVIEIGSKRNPRVHEVDVGGTENVIEATGVLHRLLPVKPFFVYIGSVHAMPEAPCGTIMTEPDRFDPAEVEGQYAQAKAEASAYVMAAIDAGLVEGCIIMPSGIIGPYEFSPESMKRLAKLALSGRIPFVVSGGYDFVDVRDVAKGALASCDRSGNGEAYILSGHYISIRDLCDTVADVAGVRRPFAALPLWVARMAAPLSEAFYRLRREVPLFTEYALQVLDSNGAFSCAKAETKLGYSRRPMRETLEDMVAWLEGCER